MNYLQSSPRFLSAPPPGQFSVDANRRRPSLIKAGARGYLLKDAPVEHIIACVRAVAGGGRYIPSIVAERLADRMQTDALSERELSILHFLASGQSNKGISRMASIGKGTVKFHVNNILTKLGTDSRTGAIASGLRRRLIAID